MLPLAALESGLGRLYYHPPVAYRGGRRTGPVPPLIDWSLVCAAARQLATSTQRRREGGNASLSARVGFVPARSKPTLAGSGSIYGRRTGGLAQELAGRLRKPETIMTVAVGGAAAANRTKG